MCIGDRWVFCFYKQKTAYEMRISDWSSDVCSSDLVLIEDTRELQCAAPNLVALRTKDGVASLSELVRSSLHLRPDRIPIGEVRGAEALDLLKAWGTGHPGGVGTIHAGTALGALRDRKSHV